MQKKKLDLNNLLAKYESHPSASQQNSRYVQPTRQHQIEEEFYQYRTYQAEQPRPQEYSQTTASLKGNFVMSKSEVEQFLLSVKDELRNEERGVALHGETALKQIHENFQRSHDKLKREILELLDRAFYENEKSIKDELNKHSKVEPLEFTAVYRKIKTVDDDINRLLALLKGPQYRKAIAEVVTRDFNLQMTELRASSAQAKSAYIHGLGEIEPDRSRIQAIKDNVLKLFYFRKREPAMSQPLMTHIKPQDDSHVYSIFKDKTHVQNVQPPQGQSRTRKSFFNFGQ